MKQLVNAAARGARILLCTSLAAPVVASQGVAANATVNAPQIERAAHRACKESGHIGTVYAGNYWTGTVDGYNVETGKVVLELPDFQHQTGTATDRYGNIYVASYDANAIFIFSPKGKQIGMIGGSNTLLGYPWELTVDPAGNIYAMSTGAASGGAGSVEVFAAGSNGNVAPIRYIAGSNTGLNDSVGIALGPDGNIFTSSYTTGAINEFALNAGTPGNVNVAPMAYVGYVGAPSQLVVNANYDVYVNGDGVWKIPWAGAAWGSPFQWNTSVNAGGGVALSANGDVYFSDYEFNDGRIVVANVNGTGGHLLATQVVGNIGLSLSGVGLIYVTNAATGQVTEYPTDADGDCAPVRTISVAPHNIGGIAVEFSGRIDVGYLDNLSGGGAGWLAFAPGDSGTATPTLQVAFPGSSIDANPTYLNLDGNDNLYASTYSGGSYLSYQRGNYGAGPTQTLTNSQFGCPRGFAVGFDGTIYAATGNECEGQGQGNSILVFAPGATGSAPPIGTISGSNTGLSEPRGGTVDAAGNIWVANQSGGSITVYAPHRYGNVSPIRTIASSAFAQPIDVKLDTSGAIYVLNQVNSIDVFNPGAKGNATPRAIITGPNTQLDGVDELAINEGG